MNPEFSRRHFLKLSALAAGATTLGFPALLRAQNAGTKLNVAVIGLGGQGRSRLDEVMGCGVKIVALCDVDERNIQAARDEMLKKHPDLPLTDAVSYSDYRKLLANEKHLDAVIIATPDHWHFHQAKASLLAGKHVFCEKPLTHTIAEARELRELAARTKVITQMGNQGSSTKNLRRGIELIQAGVLGQVKDVYVWCEGVPFHPGLAMPTVADPIPTGFNWDEWLGPAPGRLYKEHYYHPWDWRGWLDFGSGPMGDFGCHDLNLPYRALKLDYPTSIEVKAELMGLPTYPKDAHIRFEFAQRGDLAPVTINWYDQALAFKPDLNILPKAIQDHFGAEFPRGVLILGEKGFTFGGHWTCADYIKLNNEEKLSGILNHAASKDIPGTLPVSPGHMNEWVNACQGGAPVFSDFETGGHLTEIALSGVVAARVGKKLEWDGPGMRAKNAPEAGQYIHTTYRKEWI
jgi:predicted dehydrogenase